MSGDKEKPKTLREEIVAAIAAPADPEPETAEAKAERERLESKLLAELEDKHGRRWIAERRRIVGRDGKLVGQLSIEQTFRELEGRDSLHWLKHKRAEGQRNARNAKLDRQRKLPTDPKVSAEVAAIVTEKKVTPARARTMYAARLRKRFPNVSASAINKKLRKAASKKT
ncbi:MAG: hypothetical protein ABI640_10775 [Gammaproteobacteria bacterium]